MAEGFSTRSDILEGNRRDVASDQTEPHGFQAAEWNSSASSTEQPYDCSYIPNELHANVVLSCAPNFPSSSTSSFSAECVLQDPMNSGSGAIRACLPPARDAPACAELNLLSEGHNFHTASRLFERQALGSRLSSAEYAGSFQHSLNTSQSPISSFSAAAAVAAVAAAYMSSSTTGYFPSTGAAFSTSSLACPCPSSVSKSESKKVGMEVEGREAFPVNSTVGQVDISALDRFAEGLSVQPSVTSDMPFADCVAQAYDRVQELSMRADQYLHMDASSADDYLLAKQRTEYCSGSYSSRGRAPPIWLSETNRAPNLGFQYCREAFTAKADGFPSLMRDHQDQHQQQAPQQPLYPHPLVGLSTISAAPGSLVRRFPFGYTSHFSQATAQEAFINHSSKDRDESLFHSNKTSSGCLNSGSASPVAYRQETEATFQRVPLSSEPPRAKSRGDAAQKMAHVKKPLNAFMLFMKEMRAKVVAECTMKESAAINQILGRKWHALPREEQAKFYEMARREKEIHQRLYPGWSARDNYAFHAKRRKSRCRYRGVGAGTFKSGGQCGGSGGCLGKNIEQEGESPSEDGLSSGMVTPTTSPNAASVLGKDTFHGYPFNFDGVTTFHQSEGKALSCFSLMDRQPFNPVQASVSDCKFHGTCPPAFQFYPHNRF
ncbi:unnamed protein product [Schistocephalus solidus]|uniref:HMG box domain-containing protein n=1 Tax=Schistocephalus solidus TaxID=70667 RepID=A0A183TM22_SCHSO|nr:unnamed protein product [Schistocephalus solidus]